MSSPLLRRLDLAGRFFYGGMGVALAGAGLSVLPVPPFVVQVVALPGLAVVGISLAVMAWLLLDAD